MGEGDAVDKFVIYCTKDSYQERNTPMDWELRDWNYKWEDVHEKRFYLLGKLAILGFFSIFLGHFSAAIVFCIRK